MTVQMNSKMPQSLWREKAELWLNFSQADAPTVSIDRTDDDHDPEPPPARTGHAVLAPRLPGTLGTRLLLAR